MKISKISFEVRHYQVTEKFANKSLFIEVIAADGDKHSFEENYVENDYVTTLHYIFEKAEMAFVEGYLKRKRKAELGMLMNRIEKLQRFNKGKASYAAYEKCKEDVLKILEGGE